MQQTEKYKLNLIESSDPFSPEALNTNTQKLEDTLSAAIEAHEEATDARLTVLEARKFAAGGATFTRAGEQFVNLGFTPQVVFAFHGGTFTMGVYGYEVSSYIYPRENGFLVNSSMGAVGTLRYAAFA